MKQATARRKARPRRAPIHPSVKTRLGYDADEPDADVLRDWRARLRRVCKPCWELKYCPYGPLVEQSPLLPSLRHDIVEGNKYYRQCLETGYVGELSELTQEWRERYESWLKDDDLLAWQAYNELKGEERDKRVAESDDPEAAFDQMFMGELPPIHEYRAPFEVHQDRFDWSRLNQEKSKELRRRVQQRKKKLQLALETGIDDTRRPLDPGRRAWFQRNVNSFDPNEYPSEIPEVFHDGECNIFGHICPVFFAAEAFTETSAERRRGRYIPFATKMRVVRRDNHTCQHCGKHLADNEVEFDHKIPISRGGSSEEHNIRLTCFDCNRDKKDRVEI